MRDRLMECVDVFAEEMKKKLRIKRRQGYSGWDNPDLFSDINIMLKSHMENIDGEEVDIANLAMMIWNQSEIRAIQGLLLLVAIKKSFKEIASWTMEQREAVIKWAGRLHLKSSDNIVVLPPKPDFL